MNLTSHSISRLIFIYTKMKAYKFQKKHSDFYYNLRGREPVYCDSNHRSNHRKDREIELKEMGVGEIASLLNSQNKLKAIKDIYNLHHRKMSNAVFLKLDTFQKAQIFGGGACLCIVGYLAASLACTLDVISTPFLKCDNQKCFQTLSNILGKKHSKEAKITSGLRNTGLFFYIKDLEIAKRKFKL